MDVDCTVSTYAVLFFFYFRMGLSCMRWVNERRVSEWVEEGRQTSLDNWAWIPFINVLLVSLWWLDALRWWVEIQTSALVSFITLELLTQHPRELRWWGLGTYLVCTWELKYFFFFFELLHTLDIWFEFGCEFISLDLSNSFYFIFIFYPSISWPLIGISISWTSFPPLLSSPLSHFLHLSISPHLNFPSIHPSSSQAISITLQSFSHSLDSIKFFISFRIS